MRWWQIWKRNADLERELRSDLELEEEEQRERGVPSDGRAQDIEVLGIGPDEVEAGIIPLRQLYVSRVIDGQSVLARNGHHLHPIFQWRNFNL